MLEETPTQFSSVFPMIVLSRPVGQGVDWQEVDRGPGYFTLPAGDEIRVRVKSINDDELADVVTELRDVAMLRFLDLSENRNITNTGLVSLKALPQLTGLNLSSCSVTSSGMEALRSLRNLAYLNLSYCNRLTDQALKPLDTMRTLEYLDLQGCFQITKAGLTRMKNRKLQIHR